MMMTIIVIWLLVVIGGGFNLRPVPLRLIEIDSAIVYQLPANVLFFFNRLANVTIMAMFFFIFYRDQTTTKWETISSRVGRDFQGSWFHILIDYGTLDWEGGFISKLGHCIKYIGV